MAIHRRRASTAPIPCAYPSIREGSPSSRTRVHMSLSRVARAEASWTASAQRSPWPNQAMATPICPRSIRSRPATWAYCAPSRSCPYGSRPAELTSPAQRARVRSSPSTAVTRPSCRNASRIRQASTAVRPCSNSASATAAPVPVPQDGAGPPAGPGPSSSAGNSPGSGTAHPAVPCSGQASPSAGSLAGHIPESGAPCPAGASTPGSGVNSAGSAGKRPGLRGTSRGAATVAASSPPVSSTASSLRTSPTGVRAGPPRACSRRSGGSPRAGRVAAG